jgi:hypothetical protein
MTMNPAADPELDRVVETLRHRAHRLAGYASFTDLAVDSARLAIDDVLDGPRTGRWDFNALEKTEKAYVGTRLEIILRSRLDLERAPQLDVSIGGTAVDIKWSHASQWMIPQEAIGHLCLCLGGLDGMTALQAGVVRCLEPNLNPRNRQRDGKRTLSRIGRNQMVMLTPRAPLPQNFVATIPDDIRQRIFDHASIQDRVTSLFEELPLVAIPRQAIRTVAMTEGDPMRRVRRDSHRAAGEDSIVILSGKYRRDVIEQLGLEDVTSDHWIGVPPDLLKLPPPEARRQAAARRAAALRLMSPVA